MTSIYLSNKLLGLDEYLDALTALFEQLQVATIETAHPSLDLLTFAESAYFFAAIILKNTPNTNDKYLDGSDNIPNKRRRRHGASPKSPFQEAPVSVPKSTWPSYDPPPPPTQPLPPLPHRKDFPIGLIYLASPYIFSDDPLHKRELNIGIILSPQHRGKGYARQAIALVLKKAFQQAQCHRVQAILPEHIAKDRAICLFTDMRFDHEGTRRCAFFSPLENCFKDVTYMGMLDFDWALREQDVSRRNASSSSSSTLSLNQAKPTKSPNPHLKSVWDELFARHQREREDLLNWENGIAMRKSVSRATPIEGRRAQTPTQSDFRGIKHEESDVDENEDEKGKATTDMDSESSSKSGYESSSSESFSDALLPPSHPLAYPISGSEYGSDFEEIDFDELLNSIRSRSASVPASPVPMSSPTAAAAAPTNSIPNNNSPALAEESGRPPPPLAAPTTTRTSQQQQQWDMLDNGDSSSSDDEPSTSSSSPPQSESSEAYESDVSAAISDAASFVSFASSAVSVSASVLAGVVDNDNDDDAATGSAGDNGAHRGSSAASANNTNLGSAYAFVRPPRSAGRRRRVGL